MSTTVDTKDKSQILVKMCQKGDPPKVMTGKRVSAETMEESVNKKNSNYQGCSSLGNVSKGNEITCQRHACLGMPTCTAALLITAKRWKQRVLDDGPASLKC